MVAKAEELVARLKSSDAATRLKAVRDVKNQVIGSRPRKKAFLKLEVIPRIIELLAEASETSLKVQCATVVGSLARLDQESALEVLRAGGFELLLKLVESEDDATVVSGLRALNFYLEAFLSKHGDSFEVEQRYLDRCVELLCSESAAVKAQAAHFIFYCAHEQSLRVRLKEAGVVGRLLRLIEVPHPEAVTDPAIMALCVLPDGAAAEVAWHGGCVARLLERMRTNALPNVQLDCCACIALMCEARQGLDVQEARRTCLAALARHVSDWQWPSDEFSPFSVLVRLLQQEEGLKQAARDSGIVRALAQRLTYNDVAPTDLEAPLFDVISLLIDGSDEGRRQLLDVGGEQGVRRVLERMRDGDAATRAATFKCMAKLSGSVTHLRQMHGAFREAVPLCAPLLEAGQPAELRIAACRLLSNLVLRFSPAREAVWQSGCVEKLGSLVDKYHKGDELMLAALSALGNASYGVGWEERQRIMNALKCGCMLHFVLPGDDEKLKTAAVLLFQNLTAGCTAAECRTFWNWAAGGPEGFVSDEDCLYLPRQILCGWSNMPHDDSLEPAVRLASNILVALGLALDRRATLLDECMEGIKRLLGSRSDRVKSAALCVVKHLLATEAPGILTRVRALDDGGALEAIEALSGGAAALDVRESALALLDAAEAAEARAAALDELGEAMMR